MTHREQIRVETQKHSSLFFPDELIFRDGGLLDGVRWFVLCHYFRCITSKGTFTLPTGFRTDGASIPRAFHSWLGPFGTWFPAAIFHDWAYSRCSTGYFPHDRLAADLIFKELMWNLGVPWFQREIIFRAVRLCGGPSYKRR